MKLRWACTAGAAVSMLAACGGGGGTDAPDSTDPMPLSVGNRWVYEYTYRYGIDMAGTTTHEVTGQQTIDGRAAYIVRDDAFPGPRDTAYAPTDGNLLRYPASDALDGEANDGAVSILRLPLHAGDTWTSIDKTRDTGFDSDGDGVNEIETVNFHASVDAVGSVRTPLRTFDTAYPVSSHYQRQIVNPVTHEVYDTSYRFTTEWYVLGVGVVRREVSSQPYGGSRDYHGVELLKSVSIRP